MKKNIRKTTLDIRGMKGKQPIVSLTAYTAPFAKLFDDHVDILLVGDSLGMVVYGMENTLNVTMDMMINHTKAVVNGSEKSLVVADMPFASFEAGEGEAFKNAARLLAEGGASAVKIEGGVETAKTISYLVERGIPVMGHVGLMPQRIHQYGGFKTQGKDVYSHDKIKFDAAAIQSAGAFAMVLEGVVEGIANEVTDNLNIPTIGIGASKNCDGQILVCDDLLGLNNGYVPKFVKQYGHLKDDIVTAVGQYAADVRARKFPASQHCFNKSTPIKLYSSH